MFEKEAEKYGNSFEWTNDDRIIDYSKQGFKKGAEFGYKLAHEEMDYLNKHWRSEEERKANEWHFVKDKLPKKQYDKVSVTIAYLNAFRNPCKKDCFYDGKDFVYWDSGKNVGWKKADIFGMIYAWKYADDYIPELPKESE